MARQRSKPFQRTVATPRIDPDFDTWMDAWTPHSVAERAREFDGSNLAKG